MNKTFSRLLKGILIIILILFVFGAGTLVGSILFGTSNDTVGGNFTTLQRVYNIMMSDFYYGENTQEYSDKLIRDAINGMVDSQGDIHTSYMTSEQLADFTGSLESSFVGIGVTYSAIDDGILVRNVIKGSPAQDSGIIAGDVITAVDGVKIENDNIDSVVDMIKGEKGTDVSLTVSRGNTILEIVVTRDEISNTVFSEYLGQGIGLLEITSFANGSGKEVGNHLDDLNAQGTRKLIIDLRDNGGGYASTLDEISAYFMKTGDIVMRETDRDGNETIDAVKNGKGYTYEKIIVLVNGNSASCSEVFTLAMKENCGAIVVGETTYGKGIAQLTRLFADGSALKYTDQAWSSGNGVFVGGKGIEPDYTVRLPEVLYQSYLTLEDNQILEFDQVDSERISKLQLMLDFLGYDVDRNDGYFSSRTASAVRSFQNDNGIEITGNVDTETADLLNQAVIYYWQSNKALLDTQMNKALELLN